MAIAYGMFSRKISPEHERVLDLGELSVADYDEAKLSKVDLDIFSSYGWEESLNRFYRLREEQL